MKFAKLIPAPCSADERIQSLRREGWRDTWMACVMVNAGDDEVAVVFPNGTYFRGRRVSPPNTSSTAN